MVTYTPVRLFGIVYRTRLTVAPAFAGEPSVNRGVVRASNGRHRRGRPQPPRGQTGAITARERSVAAAFHAIRRQRRRGVTDVPDVPAASVITGNQARARLL